MDPDEFARAADALGAGAAQVMVAGMAGPLGREHARLARLAAGCDRLFVLRPPWAPGVVICGASHRPGPGAQVQHAAGLWRDARGAWCRAMGEVAEARGLHLAGDGGSLPLLGHDLRPCGTIPAAQVRRQPGDAAPVHGLGAGADLAQAARSAWHEAVERHAIALWLAGDAPARPLGTEPTALRALETALRGGVAQAPLRFLQLPGAVPGLVVVVALSDRPEGVVPGYGCAPDLTEAACKAATEVILGEFGLDLERRRAAPGAAPGQARARRLAERPDLIRPGSGPLDAGAALVPCFAVLTRCDDGVPVVRVVADGLRTPAPGAV